MIGLPRARAASSIDTHRKKLLSTLDDRLTWTSTAAVETEGKYSEAAKSMDQLKEGISGIVGKVAGNTAKGQDLLNTQINDTNMMQYLGMQLCCLL